MSDIRKEFSRLAKQIVSRTRSAAIKAGQVTERDRMLAKRKRKAAADARALSETLPDGTTPKLRASLGAAYRRHADDPETQERVARAQTAKRVEMAKRESGITDQGPPKRFLGMDEDQWAQEVQNSLPPPIGELRKKAKKK